MKKNKNKNENKVCEKIKSKKGKKYVHQEISFLNFDALFQRRELVNKKHYLRFRQIFKKYMKRKIREIDWPDFFFNVSF